MFILEFPNGEFLHNVTLNPFHYVLTTERLDARFYQHYSTALVDAGIIRDETGVEPEVAVAPMSY